MKVAAALNVCQAMECYAKAAKLSHARSAHNLASLLLQSSFSSTPTDDQQHEAVELLEQAAGLGLREVYSMTPPLLLAFMLLMGHLDGKNNCSSNIQKFFWRRLLSEILVNSAINGYLLVIVTRFLYKFTDFCNSKTILEA